MALSPPHDQVNFPAASLPGVESSWMFWPATRLRADSAWIGHMPFAHWIVSAMRPTVFVELGTHSGASYAAFCEAVVRSQSQTTCYAVDTWLGDSHAGRYSEDIYHDLSAFNSARYAEFSTLLRKTFDAALDDFADGSVDLLHIDGLHTYEAVHHDFTTWLPKLSNHAVVLFHDTQERQADFGVWRFWAELRQTYPGFEFTHSHGLGVLRVGRRVTDGVAKLFNVTSPEEIQRIQRTFEFLGGRFQNDLNFLKLQADARRLLERLKRVEGENRRLASELAAHQAKSS